MRISAVCQAAVVSLVLLVGAGSAQADERLPAKLRVTVLLTTLAYDSQLVQSRSGGLRIGVVYRAGDSIGSQEARETLTVLEQSADRKVKGLSISAILVQASGQADIDQAILRDRLNLLYLCDGLASLAGPAIELANQRRILILAGGSALVRAGAGIGVVKRGGKPKILVNPEAVKKQGAQLEPRVLRLVELVGQ